MSKQAGKQRTLDFFYKNKQSNPTPTTKAAASSGSASQNQTDKSGKTSGDALKNAEPKAPIAAPTKDASAKAQATQVKSKPPLTEIRNPDASTRNDSSPTVPYGFSSSRSVASDARSVSSVGSRETPPTSDILDVDMLDEELEELEAADYQPKRLKRKYSIVESDEDEGTTKEDDGGAKKRKSVDLSGDRSSTEAVSSRKKQAARPVKRRKTHDYDDDFVVPDDEEESDDDPVVLDVEASDDSPKPKKSKLKKKASTISLVSDDEAGTGRKATKAARPTFEHASSSRTSAGGFGILTAAERRAQTQKDEKKDQEKPYDFLQDVRDKDGVRPGEEGYDPRTLYVPPSAWKTFTPFEVQFWEIKQNQYDTILFFQKGKFYELYEDDARIGHQQFDLKLTQRVKMSMVGVPEMSFDFWANKFLAKGYKVGKVEQSETSIGAEMRAAAGGAKGKADKLVKRVLNKVFTNGTLMDGEYLNDEEASHCISLREHGENTFGLAILDSSTSEFKLSSFEDDVCRTKLETLLRQLRPKEIIVSKGNLSVSTNRLLKNILPGSCTWTSLRSVEGYDYQTTLSELEKLYPNEDKSQGDEFSSLPAAIQSMIYDETAIQALGSMIWYLRQLNIDSALLSAKNFNIYDPMRKGEGLVLDGQTLAHIEVLLNNDGTDDGTLLKLLGRCVTPFGKRLFRIWLCMPLKDIKQINERLDAVEDLMKHETFAKDFQELVRGMPDLERIVSRIHAGTCKIKDFLKSLDAFRKLNKGLSELADKSAGFETTSVSGLLRSAEDLSPYLKGVRNMFVQPSSPESSELVPQDGVDEDYDEVAKEIADIEADLGQSLQKLAKKLGIKLAFWHSATGIKDIFIVEVDAADKKKVPKDWQKHTETKAKTRFTVPDLAHSIRKIKEAKENEKAAIKAFTSRLYQAFDTDRDVWLRTLRVTAELDCLLSLAKASEAIGSPSCRPEFVDRDQAFVDFEELRHPGIALALGAKGGADFIANDVKMGGDVSRIMLLTGPNMAGKSTLMRQTCVGVIMAQLGMYVPASSARLAPVDAILTRMGAYDNMFSNSSTFKVELDECCKIIREATPRSLVILDELGRGTSTFDGIAIAGAALHHLATHTLALSCFATHYSSLTNDYKYHPNIRMMHMATAIDDEKRELIWLYKLVEGVASSSFGTHVANLAGVPADVIKRADVVSQDFSRQFAARLAGRTSGSMPVTAQMDLSFLSKLAEGKIQPDADNVRKREVLKILKKIAAGYAATIR